MSEHLCYVFHCNAGECTNTLVSTYSVGVNALQYEEAEALLNSTVEVVREGWLVRNESDGSRSHYCPSHWKDA